MKLPQIFADPANIRSFVQGAVIFQAGDDAGEMFVVHTGEVDIVINGEVVETIGPDGFFGEMSLIDDSVRSADAVARSDCRLLPVNRHHFLFLVNETPLFALHVMKGMADRLRRAAKHEEV
ncbi:MAG: Crp/Fnr family transcriptional regulator [Prosthecobacter sp.]|uniref:Crp/Fnr family transcriptional regulator n=1 Tax=Prosthecobacter sp. TaxID=1965333 RepID=UPI0039023BC0